MRAKKPAADAYLRAIALLGVGPGDCLAFEDSHSGLMAARSARIAAMVTQSLRTAHESFEGAAKVLADLSSFDLAARQWRDSHKRFVRDPLPVVPAMTAAIQASPVQSFTRSSRIMFFLRESGNPGSAAVRFAKSEFSFSRE